MIRDTRPTYDALRPGPIVGFRGVAGSMLIHLTLLGAIVSHDAYLHTQQARTGRGVAAADATGRVQRLGRSRIAPSAAVVRAGDFGVAG